jgi:hypothetical protein
MGTYGKTTRFQRLALFLLDKAEKNFLRAFGWKNVGKDNWNSPQNYHKTYEGVRQGHAMNSQKQYCGQWGLYADAKDIVTKVKDKMAAGKRE